MGQGPAGGMKEGLISAFRRRAYRNGVFRRQSFQKTLFAWV
jgi:hypothetical protein